jgi:ERCC4-related helicase
MRWLINKLEYIQSLGEKVIVFTELRSIQRDLRLTIMERFSLPDVHIINGDTAATAGRGLSRQGIIDKFQAQPGFGVIILSTSAVGFGVNVQAANHVIHFTRSWNPAKEDQATDRAYRIGQTREVHVYYPTVVSEHYATFENKLDDLLSRKRAVAGDMLNGAEEVDVLALAESGC